jgi:hypothetical protein
MDPRNHLFHAIQATLGGHTETDVIAALISSLVVAIGVQAPDLQEAIYAIEDLPHTMKPILHQEWPKLRRHRAAMNLRAAVEKAAE